jgi:hypothetical protein
VAAVDVPPDLIITITDARRAGYCVRGIKAWAERHQFDFRAFLANGISANELLTAGDALATRVVARKLGRPQ